MNIYFIKKTHSECIVKFVGNASETGTLNLVNDLCVANQFASNPQVTVRAVASSLEQNSKATILRGSTPIFTIIGNSNAQHGDAVTLLNNDISVTFGSNGGTVILCMSKKSGYTAIMLNNSEYGSPYVQSAYNDTGY